MDVRVVDRCATSGDSRLHHAAPAAKLAAFALVLAGVVAQQNLLVVAGVALTVLAAATAARLPLRPLLALAAYPGLFAALFALAAATDPLHGALFVTKAVASALTALVLVFTTPYPLVFAPVQAVVPGIVGDALLMTYRSLFLLAEKLDRLRVAVRLRSGVAARQPLRAARATAGALGSLVLYAFDLAQREYDVMRLRGYEGRLRATPPPSRSRAFDAALLAGATAVSATAIGFRIAGAAGTPLSWLAAAAGLAALTLSWIGRTLR